MRAVSDEQGWELDLGTVAQLWRGGCIIRSSLLGKIHGAFPRKPELPNLLVDNFFSQAVGTAQSSWRRVVVLAVKLGIPALAIGSALAFHDSYRSEHLPASLLQAQRDYFGAHAYERIDKPRGEYFHTDWTGTGGATASSNYEI